MSKSITELIRDLIEKENFTLPVFPPVALEIQQAIQNNRSLKEIEALILKDQTLSAEILRLANSAFFAGLTRQKTVNQALVRLGMNQVFTIVLAASQKQAFKARNKFLDELMKVLWQHAITSASYCRWLARKCHYNELADDAFMAGLFHDLGSLMVLKALDELSAREQVGHLSEELTIEVIDSLHTQYGYRAMLSWELPPIYAEIARDHHQDQADQSNLLLNFVKLVDAACRKAGIGLVHDPELSLEGLDEASNIGIKDVHLAELEIELEDHLDSYDQVA